MASQLVVGAEDVAGRLNHLVRLATSTDEVGPLVAAAWADLRRPIAVVDHLGLPVARHPAAGPGRQALALAATAARGERRTASTAGWLVSALRVDDEVHGVVALGRTPPLTAADEAVVELLISLLGDQLRRRTLAQLVRQERLQTLMRRLVTDPALAAQAPREFLEHGIALVGHYWPSLLVAERGELSEPSLRAAEDLARRSAAGSLMVPMDGQTVGFLFAAETGQQEQEVRTSLEHIVRFVRRRQPGLHVHGIAADRPVALAELARHMTVLQRLRRYPRRELDVLNERNFALNRLLAGLDRARAAEFVNAQVGPVVDHDHRTGSVLADTLEAAMDYSHRDEAARVSFMHRNTFRRHLKQALELLGTDLNDPDERLAVHVALKLRKLLGPPGAPR